MIPSLGGAAARLLAARTVVALDRSRCVRHRFARSSCRHCTEGCSSGAVRWTEQGLAVAAGTCSLCLLCTAVCPTQALRSPGQHLSALINDLSAHTRPVLGCRKHPADAVHGRLPCLGSLASAHLLLLLDLLFPDGLQINLSQCRGCENERILPAIGDVRQRLAAAGWESRITFIDDPRMIDCQPSALSRREMLTFFKMRSARSASQVAGQILEQSTIKPYGDKKQPETHALLMKVLERQPDDARARQAWQLIAPALEVSAQCSGCSGCIGICPAGALTPATDEKSAPHYSARLCLACGLCASFCRRKAIHLQPPVMMTATPVHPL